MVLGEIGMSQPTPNQDWPAWIVAVSATVPIAAVPFAWLAKKLSNKVSRKEWEAYLKQRDDLSEARHKENLSNFRTVTAAVNDVGQRISHVEGAMSGTYRRPT